jgi:hypothetical protein
MARKYFTLAVVVLVGVLTVGASAQFNQSGPTNCNKCQQFNVTEGLIDASPFGGSIGGQAAGVSTLYNQASFSSLDALIIDPSASGVEVLSGGVTPSSPYADEMGDAGPAQLTTQLPGGAGSWGGINWNGGMRGPGNIPVGQKFSDMQTGVIVGAGAGTLAAAEMAGMGLSAGAIAGAQYLARLATGYIAAQKFIEEGYLLDSGDHNG